MATTPIGQVSKRREISMRYPLAAAVLITLLASTAGVSPRFIQPVQAQTVQPQTWGPASMQASDTIGRSYPTTHRDSRTHRRRRAHRSPPNQRKIAENRGYKQVSDLVNFPKFFPSLGVLYVKPDTLPLGPFLCFDRKDRLMATVYMVPIKDMDDHKSFGAPAFAGRVDHVNIYFNAGHPGVDVPHYHFVMWHVSKQDEARVAK
jgi:hypothetical protein